MEKVGWKTVKLKLDLKYLQTCLDLDLCSEFLKFKPPNFKAYSKPREIYRLVVRKKLKEIKCERNVADRKYQTIKIGIFEELSLLEKSCFIHLLKKKFEQNAKTMLNTHQRKLINLYRKQTSRVPHAINTLSDKKLSLKETNALRYGLKHHLPRKKVKQDEVKTNVEKLIYSLKRNNPNIPIDDEFQDQTKFYMKRFLTECNRLCSTNQNQSLHSTLRKLRQNENIKICLYDKRNLVVVLSSEAYY